MSPEQLEELERILGWRFGDRALLQQAVTHSTYANEHPGTGGHNERLEFLGDAVLGLLASRLLYKRLPDAPEGELSRRRASMVRRESWVRLAEELRLAPFLQLGEGQRKAGVLESARLLADAFEALAGAVFLDGGLDAAETAFGPHLATAIDHALETRDAKTMLQELCHERSMGTPIYKVVQVSGPDHARLYDCEVWVNGALWGRGGGRSKKIAEQACAEQALAKMEPSS